MFITPTFYDKQTRNRRKESTWLTLIGFSRLFLLETDLLDMIQSL